MGMEGGQVWPTPGLRWHSVGSQSHGLSIMVIATVDSRQAILLDRTALCSLCQTQKILLIAHRLGLSLAWMQGTVAGRTSII